MSEWAGPAVSIVIPAHNEEARIERAISGFGRVLNENARPGYDLRMVEMIVVSDGSTDATVATARNLMSREGIPGRVLELAPCRGKGGALRAGFLAAEGKFALFSDADLAVPAETIWPLLAELEQGADVVIGSRRHALSRVDVRQGKIRETLGAGFTAISNAILGTHCTDFTCGFKGYTREAARAIYGRLTICGWAYDAEAVFLAERLGFRVREIPVAWADVEGSKVEMSREVFRCLRDLVRIRASALTKPTN